MRAFGAAGFEGKGKLAFLPNHEYELAFKTRVTVSHPSTPSTRPSRADRCAGRRPDNTASFFRGSAS